MQSKLVGAVSVLSAFVTFDVSRAAPAGASDVNEFLKPQSFAELLDPVPNALALLKEVDEAQAAQQKANPQVAQYYYHHSSSSPSSPPFGLRMGASHLL